MNEIQISNNSMPTVSGCDFCIATEAFYHADRTTDFHVLIYVTEGVIYVTEEKNDYEIRPGELLILKKGVQHFGKKIIPRGTQWYFVHFNLGSEEKYPAFQPSRGPMKQYEPLLCSMTLPKNLSGLTKKPLETSIKALADYFHSDDPMREWNMNLYLFQLLTDLSIYQKEVGKAPSLSDRICDYLNLHISEPFSSNSLEHHFFLSYKHMAATFKKEKQLTMQQYHTKLRMNAACKLLKSTLLSVNEIGSYLGYSDQLYFSRCFHEHHGMSPTNYRKTQISHY